MTTSNDSASSFLPNLVSPLLGANIVFATDEWFAAAGFHIAYLSEYYPNRLNQ